MDDRELCRIQGTRNGVRNRQTQAKSSGVLISLLWPGPGRVIVIKVVVVGLSGQAEVQPIFPVRFRIFNPHKGPRNEIANWCREPSVIR